MNIGGITMTQELEIEFKNILTKEEYMALRKKYNLLHQSPVSQINHYFETNTLSLKKKGCALRIREKNQQYKLTLKQPYQDGLLETHDSLTEEEMTNWLKGKIIRKPNVAAQLEELDISLLDLTYWGKLTTNRIEHQLTNGLLVLDHSIYQNQEDYELELEVQSYHSGQQVFYSILSENHIPKRETPNKIQRFFATLDR